MKKRFLSVLLSVVLLICMIPAGALGVRAEETGLTTSDASLDMLKGFEGFSSTPYWDYSQWTIGYGTRCPDEDLERYRKDGITEEEAEQLLRTYLKNSPEKSLNSFAAKYGLSLSQNQFDALILFTYNVGSSWMFDESHLITQAVINGAAGNDFIFPIGLWCSAGGNILPGLLNRRLSEANMYLNGVYSAAPPANYGYVRYDANGGKVQYRIQAYDVDATSEIRMTPTCNGYQFEGWYTSRSGGSKVEVLDSAVKNMTLYARWSDAETGEVMTPVEKEPESDKIDPVKVTVTADYVNLRSGPGTNYAIVGTANYGKPLTITATATGTGYTWGKFDGGWIALHLTDFNDVENGVVKPEEKPEENQNGESSKGYVTSDDGLRIRSGAGIYHSVVGYLSYKDRVEVLERTTVEGTPWGRISSGWICLDYVKFDQAEKPEQTKPEETKPEQTKPQETKPQETKPQETKPEKPASQMGTVNTEDLRIRTGPSTAYSIVGYLNTGDRVEILEQKSSGSMMWGKISKGWISLDYVDLDSDKEEQPSQPDQGDGESVSGKVVFTDELRIRSGPGTDYSIAGYLTRGTKVTITQRKDRQGMTWGKIDKGWISMDYVEVDSGNSESSEGKLGTVRVNDVLRIRSGAGTTYSINGYLTNGERVTITEVKSAEGMEWGRISKGWISLDYVVMDDASDNSAPETKPEETKPSGKQMTVTADCLHIRSGAGIDHAIVGYLYEGAKVVVMETKSAGGMDWGKISDGWICMDYVR